MTEKIYEYKDDQNHFLAKWDEFSYQTCFGDNGHYEEALELSFRLQKALLLDDLQVFIARLTSLDTFLNFLVDTVREELGRDLRLLKHQGANLVLENDRLLFLDLPKEGVDFTDFFGQKEAQDTLLIATRNEGKTAEFRKIFEKLGYAVENLNDHPDLPEVAETGLTFEENARLKAETIAQLTGKMVLADDSGLKVDVLGGLPGVWSARFAGTGASDLENNAKLLHELAMVFEPKDRSAQFHCTLVVASPDKESLVVEAEWPGYINFEPKGENGFGYDPLFLVGESGRTSAELSMDEKNAQSHRALAVKKLIEVFPAWKSKPSL